LVLQAGSPARLQPEQQLQQRPDPCPLPLPLPGQLQQTETEVQDRSPHELTVRRIWVWWGSTAAPCKFRVDPAVLSMASGNAWDICDCSADSSDLAVLMHSLQLNVRTTLTRDALYPHRADAQ
jgi:hypothetical protein